MATEGTQHRRDRVGDLSQTVESPVGGPADFSLVLGGPLYQIWRSTHLAGSSLQFLPRRILVLTLLTWVPLFILSVAEGHAWGTSLGVPFLYDVEEHVRFLIALPLLLIAEPIVNHRLQPVVAPFVERGLISASSRGTFDAAIASAMRLRNSIWAELFLVAFVYVVGVGVFWRSQMVLDVNGWDGVSLNGTWSLSMAGWWLWCVSLPIFQFLLLRWYFRLFIWAQFLWRVSRIKLALMPTYPDRCGGLGFLGSVSHVFAPLLLAQGALLAGMMANRIFYTGAKLLQFKLELIGLVGFLVFAVLGPLLVFSGQLASAKRTGLREHGALAERYVRAYDQKWLLGGAPANESLLGSADIQSLADLGNNFAFVTDMKSVPFNVHTVLHLAALTLLPALPLTLTMISLDQLVSRLLKILL